MNRRRFLSRSAVAAAGVMLGSGRAGAAPSDVGVMFTLNVQDFTYPDLTAQLLTAALDLHESLGVPFDISLTTWMVDLLQQAPDIARRLVTSPMVCLNYHTRPPQPYHVNYDWAGLSALTHAQQYDFIRNYETHGLNMTTGQPDARPGSYQYYAQLIGHAPTTVGDLAENSIQAAADAVFRDLGTRMCIVHGRATNLGDTRNGLFTRPEHVDYRLFEYVGQDPRPVLEAAFTTARSTSGARAPYMVGIKMHDNDFFAEESAWVTVYQQSRRAPSWDTSRRSPRIPWETTLAMWSLWETLVRYVVSEQIAVVNSTGVLRYLPAR